MLDQLEGKQFINLETYRRDGRAVRTPVWFVREGNAAYVWTQADSGKAKRVRNNGKVKVAPCERDGAVIGAWSSAMAREMRDDASVQKVQGMMRKKYGLMMRMFELMGGVRPQQRTVIELREG